MFSLSNHLSSTGRESRFGPSPLWAGCLGCNTSVAVLQSSPQKRRSSSERSAPIRFEKLGQTGLASVGSTAPGLTLLLCSWVELTRARQYRIAVKQVQEKALQKDEYRVRELRRFTVRRLSGILLNICVGRAQRRRRFARRQGALQTCSSTLATLAKRCRARGAGLPPQMFSGLQVGVSWFQKRR